MESSMVELREQVEVDGRTVLATLHPHGLLQWEGEMLRGSITLQDDLLGFTKGSPASITLHTFKMGIASCLGRSRKRTRKDIEFTIATRDSYNLWCESLQRHLDLQETQYQLHAKELAKTMDLLAFDGVVCVSGDGVLVEVLNGLLERPDWEKAIKMPIGAIPAGSGNGIATSLLISGSEPCDAAHAAFAIIRGHKQPLDVATLVQGQARFHSIFGLLWGISADVDIESEILRCLGNLRFDIYSLIRIISLRHYNGNLAYIPAPGYEAFGIPLGEDAREALLSNDVTIQIDSERGYAGPDIATRKDEWQTIPGPFTLVWMQNVSHATVGMIPTPLAKFADGYMDLMIIRECPRWKMLMLFLKLADGSHIQSEYVQYVKVRAFRLAPGGIVGSEGNGGIISVDGEVIARGKGVHGSNRNDIMVYGPPIELSITKGFATMFSPPNESQNNDTFSPL